MLRGANSHRGETSRYLFWLRIFKSDFTICMLNRLSCCIEMSSRVIVSSSLRYSWNVVLFSILYYVDLFRYIFFQERNYFLVFLVVWIGSRSGFQCFTSQCEVSNDSFSSTLPLSVSLLNSLRRLIRENEQALQVRDRSPAHHV